jgi:ABC-type transport system involved in cytochrome bd biosynthesis fused ATPase/permease subunit
LRRSVAATFRLEGASSGLILVLDQGTLVESGSHEERMERSGLDRDMVVLQTSNEPAKETAKNLANR